MPSRVRTSSGTVIPGGIGVVRRVITDFSLADTLLGVSNRIRRRRATRSRRSVRRSTGAAVRSVDISCRDPSRRRSWPLYLCLRESAAPSIGDLGRRSPCPMSLSVAHVAARHYEGTNPVCAARVPRGEDVAEEVETAQPPLADLPGERHFTDQAARQPYRLRHRLRALAHPRPQPLRHLATLERLASARRLLDRRA